MTYLYLKKSFSKIYYFLIQKHEKQNNGYIPCGLLYYDYTNNNNTTYSHVTIKAQMVTIECDLEMCQNE